jgi:YVTN family beta-propeller protein
MTLNITYADQAGIYQSSDHRLSWNDGMTADSAYKHLSIRSGLGDPAWFGSVTYTGIGRFDDIDVTRWFARHLAGRGMGGWTLEDVAEIVRSECERQAVRHRDRRLTLVLAGYSSGSARVFLISNFQSIESRTGILRSEGQSSTTFHVDDVRADGRLLITGAEAAVSRKSRRDLTRILRRLAGDKQNTIAIFEALAAANARAARSGVQGADGISPTCMCYSMLPDGTSSSARSGPGMQSAYMPPLVMGDIDMGEFLGNVIAEMHERGEFGPAARTQWIAGAEAERQLVRADLVAEAMRERVRFRMATAKSAAAPFASVASIHEAYVPHLTGQVTVIDTTKLIVKEVIPIAARAASATVHPTGDLVYVAADPRQPGDGRSSLLVIETANRRIRRLEVGTAINGVVVHPAGEVIYVADPFGDCIYVVDQTGTTILDVVIIPGTPNGMALTRDGRSLFVACGQANVIAQIDTVSNAVVSVVQAIANPYAVSVSVDGTRLFTSNDGSNSVSSINLATRQSIDVPVMRQPRAAALVPSGEFWYVANVSSAHVSVIETAAFVEVARIPVGTHPNGIAVEPDGMRVFVTNGQSATVSVIEAGANRLIATIPVGDQPIAIGQFVH